MTVSSLARDSAALGVRATVLRSTLALWLLLGLLGGLTPGLLSGPVQAEQAGSAVRRVAAGSLAVGRKHTCVVLTTGRVRCWGRGSSGQLGHDDIASIGDGRGRSIKAAGSVPVGATVAAIAAGNQFTCALLTTGAVRCWGGDRFGQLGYNTTAIVGNGRGRSIKAVGDVPLGGKAIAIAAGGFHACALLASGGVRCWGLNEEGQLGYNSTTRVGDGSGPSIQAAGDVPLGGRAVAITAGYIHTCALLTTGAVRCWGDDEKGQLGYNSTTDVGDGSGPSIQAAGDVPLGGRAVAITAGWSHTCALLASGALRCWGWGEAGELGHNSTASIGNGRGKSIRAAGNVPLGGTAIAISAGAFHTCAVLTTHAVRCWGQGARGGLGYHDFASVGDGNGKSIRKAGDVPLGGKAAAIAASLSHTCALLTTGRVRCWGSGRAGKLGHNSTAGIGGGFRRSIIEAGDVPLGGRARVSRR